MTPVAGEPLGIEYIGDGRWRLTRPFIYVDEDLGAIRVPAGTETDLDSVPRLPFAYWMVKNCSVTGAAVHDYLYLTGEVYRPSDQAKKITITRKQADNVFLNVMRDEGVSWWQRKMIYMGVRVGGGKAWARYRNQRA